MNLQTKRTLPFLLVVFSCFQLAAQAPKGYYDDAYGKKSADLKTAMHKIIKGHTTLSYKSLFEHYIKTDSKEDGTVWDMYSDGNSKGYFFNHQDDQCGTYKVEGDCYNREHSMPKSWFNDASPMYSDIMHLVPTDGKVNGMRSNHPFSEVSNPTWTSLNGCKVGPSSYPGYSGTAFEPIDIYKGDFARIYFYMVTCYEDKVSTWGREMLAGNKYPAFTSWAQSLLLKWSRNDKVSEKEIDRNNAIYLIQGNRNPFVDFPMLAEYVWGDSINVAFYPGNDPGPGPDPDPENALVYFNGPWNEMPSGFKTNSSAYYEDYSWLAFNSEADYLTVSFSGTPDKLSFVMKPFDAWGSYENHLYVYESESGSEWGNPIRNFDNTFVNDVEVSSGEIQLSKTTRSIMLEYEKESQNIGIDKLLITKGEEDPGPGPDPDPEFIVNFSGPWNDMPQGFKSSSSAYYSSNSLLAFKKNNDYLTVSFSEVPDKLSFDMEPHNAWGSADNHLYVYESVSGSDWGTPIRDFDNSFVDDVLVNSGEIQLDKSSRNIKLEYKKESQNVGIDNLIITKRKGDVGLEDNVEEVEPILYTAMGYLYCANAEIGSTIRIYNLMGQPVAQSVVSSDAFAMELSQDKLLIVQVIDTKGNIRTYKMRNL